MLGTYTRKYRSKSQLYTNRVGLGEVDIDDENGEDGEFSVGALFPKPT
jgi:hypothetical protein